jgi:glycosyltransferase involved in cell wall biosynthesis
MIGRVESYKCPEAFVEIANRCRSSSPDLEFLIAGPDEHGLIPPLASECRRVGVQLDVRRLPEATFADYVGRAMAVCMPYRDASDSGVAPIAFEFGTPVIGSAVGGLVASIQHDVNGVLCCPGEINQFVDAIKRIASDSVLFAELSSGAQRSAHPHSPAGVLERIEAALQ